MNLRELIPNSDLLIKYAGLQEAASAQRTANIGKSYRFNDVEFLFYASMRQLIEPGRELVVDPWHSAVIDWLKDNKGRNLIISGGVGIGKTVAMQAIANVVNFNKIGGVKMELLPYYSFKFDGAGGAIRPQTTHLGLDDLGCEEDINDFGNVKNWFAKYVSRNYISRNQTFVVMTNLTAKEMLERYGERVMDRLVGMCDMFEVANQKSHRQDGFTFKKI